MRMRAHVVVSGRVQGVCFRHYALKWADGLGLKGWVRNLWDGRVEAVIEGEKEKVEEMVNKMRVGPSWAVVEEIDVRWEDYGGEFPDFRIARQLD